MLTTAIIPARGGSKGIPGKNLRRVGGRTLVERAVAACQGSSLIDEVYVSTDDIEIARVAESAGAGVIIRPDALASDTASSESALLHALDQLARAGSAPDVLVFVQCTSPFVAPDDLDQGIDLILRGAADSAFAAVPTYEFLWRDADRGGMAGVNHDPDHRPRRQDRRPDHRETGAFYVVDADGFRNARHRFFGRIVAVDVPELSAVEIDHEPDLILAQALATILDRPTPVDVDVLLTDFDGVHTDDSVLVDQHGVESVRVSRSDGMGVERLRAAGVPVVIVSKETNPVVRARAAKLGVEVRHGIEDKAAVVSAWLRDHGIAAERAAYLGNDVNDLPAMQLVGWPVAVADAHPAVRAAARLVLTRPGGHGAVREVCEAIALARTVTQRLETVPA